MSRLRGHWPEAPDSTYNRRLTARLAVLAKRSEPGRHTSRPTVDGPGRTYPTQLRCGSCLDFLEDAKLGFRSSGDSSCFDAAPPAGNGCGLHPVSTVRLGAVERLVGRLQHKIRVQLILRGGCDSNADCHRKR